jgi:hypothetical protein
MMVSRGKDDVLLKEIGVELLPSASDSVHRGPFDILKSRKLDELRR